MSTGRSIEKAGTRLTPVGIANMPSMEDMMVASPGPDEQVDPMSYFDSPGPFELEIGCGKGGFLVSRAKAAPSARLLGIEWANKYFRYCADRLARWNLQNVRVMRTDAKYFVLRNLPPLSVTVLHLYHPDPWPKKRHHKRRLVQPDFVEAAARIIRNGGRFLIQSDHEPYFTQIVELVSAHRAFQTSEWEETRVPVDAGWSGTNFEIKYAREGRDIYRVAYRRR